MRFTILQLSDLHFRDGNNSISDKASKIAGAVWAEEPTAAGYLVLLTGDLAYSGKKAEYERAAIFLAELKTALVDRNTAPIVAVASIPGNHDCDFTAEPDTRRLAITHLKSDFETFEITGDLARQCLSVQDDFFNFLQEHEGFSVTETPHKFFSTKIFTFQTFAIRVNCYNTAWLSRKNEKQGELLYPVHSVSSEVQKLTRADLVVSTLHHPYNWFPAANGRSLRKLIEATSDIVFTGHEHEALSFGKDVHLSDQHLYYFEGAALQSEGLPSGFNAIFVDTSTSEISSAEFLWKGGLYQRQTEPTWLSIKRNSALPTPSFVNKPDFEKHLNDLGTGFTHPQVKTALRREDLFLYPDLVRRTFKNEGTNGGHRRIEGRDLVNELWQCKLAVISGSDLSGKSTLAKSLYSDIKDKYDIVPILTTGDRLSATNPTEVKRLIDSAVSEQYGAVLVTPIAQLNSDRKALIIDDFHLCKLNSKGQRRFLEIIRAAFDTIIVFADEFYVLEEMRALDEDESNYLFLDFECFNILELGHYLKGKLIERWVLLGREYSASKSEVDQEILTRERLVSTMLGKNLLPSNPLTILTLLQAFEANRSHDTPGSYGYLYETLIIQALSSVELKGVDVDVAMAFLSYVAFTMFSQETTDGLTEAEFQTAINNYVAYSQVRLPDELLDRLITARVLRRDGQYFDFSYPYYRYFFVARYIRDHITAPDYAVELRSRVTEMAQHLHYEEYANVLMFYVYLSKDVNAIQSILLNSRLVYAEHAPCDFDKDVKFVNDLYVRYDSPEKLILPSSSADENRDRFRRQLDSEEQLQDAEATDERRGEKLKYDKTLSDFIKVNIATKTLQILGQVIRNSPGSIPGDVKQEVASEAYLLGLRTLNAILGIPAMNLDGTRRYIAEVVKEHRAARNQPPLRDIDLLNIADQGIIHLTQAFAHGMIRRISQAVGLRQLEEIYKGILAKHGHKVAVRLIDLAIKLDHFGNEPPLNDIFKFDSEIRSNYYAHSTLRDLVYEFCYLRHVKYNVRAKLASRFKFEGTSAKLVDNPNKRGRQ